MYTARPGVLQHSGSLVHCRAPSLQRAPDRAVALPPPAAVSNKPFERQEDGKNIRRSVLERDPERRPPPQQPGTGHGPRFQEFNHESSRQSYSFYSEDSFKFLGVNQPVREALANIGIERPSNVQATSIAAFAAQSQHIVVADHSGSGKTLAYLIPLVQMLKEEEEFLGRAATVPNCPRVVVVCPTAELCAQVVLTAKALSAHLPFRALAITGSHKRRTQIQMLNQGLDLVAATPTRLQDFLDNGKLRLTYCKALVFDEVDVLLGDTHAFAEQVLPIRELAADNTRFVFVTATLPESVFYSLSMDFPGIECALGPGLHRAQPGLTEQLIDCSGGIEHTLDGSTQRKCMALLGSLQAQRAMRTMVFCNKIEVCRKVENFLERHFRGDDTVEVLPCHSAIRDDVREGNLKRFLSPPETQNMVLVCTDRASRGIDTSYVRHVVLFEFPRDPSEYVRRIGRTARGADGTGTVTVLALGKQVALAREIMRKSESGAPIHAVPMADPFAEVRRLKFVEGGKPSPPQRSDRRY